MIQTFLSYFIGEVKRVRGRRDALEAKALAEVLYRQYFSGLWALD